MEVVSGDGKTSLLLHSPKSSSTIIFSNICQIKIIPYKNLVILESRVGSQTKNMSLRNSNKNVIVLIIKIN